MTTKTDFAAQARNAARMLRTLADEAASVDGGVPQRARDEVAEYLRLAAESCDDAAGAMERA